MMLLPWISTNNRKEKRVRVTKPDILSEQVKGILQKADQKLILMVRG